jgi:hypothetical protein
MRRAPLPSKAVISAGYDPDTQLLELEFQGGRVYRYRGVPEGVYAFLLRTPSKGGYVSRIIDGQYPHEEVTPPAPEQGLLGALRASLANAGEGQE